MLGGDHEPGNPTSGQYHVGETADHVRYPLRHQHEARASLRGVRHRRGDRCTAGVLIAIDVGSLLDSNRSHIYFGGVATTQAILQAVTGRGNLPQFANVAPTLVIAALFDPLRRRIQSFIDRRFYRKKYDAAKTLETFSVKLRGGTDLATVGNDLIGVVRETCSRLWRRARRRPVRG